MRTVAQERILAQGREKKKEERGKRCGLPNLISVKLRPLEVDSLNYGRNAGLKLDATDSWA